MRRTSFSDMSCSIARCLEQIGDWWTLLLIREALSGTRRFGEFQAHLGIAPNVLATRLQGLVHHGILQVTDTSENGRALAYRLTDKGRDLFPIIVALAQWGDRHAAAPEGPPVQIVDRATQRPIAPLQVRSEDGRILHARDAALAPAHLVALGDLASSTTSGDAPDHPSSQQTRDGNATSQPGS
jgi:DNA-binding HxlR family transcriptional regulator